jgi:hypothetical protein
MYTDSTDSAATLAACLTEARARGVDVRELGYTRAFMTPDEYTRHIRRAHPDILATPARLEWLTSPVVCRYTGDTIIGYIHMLAYVDSNGETNIPAFTPIALYPSEA